MPKQQQKKVVTVTSKPQGKPKQTTTTVTVSKSPQKSPSKRRRNRKNKNKFGPPGPRTTQSIELALSRGMRDMTANSYMSCRLGAMADGKGFSIPDGRSGVHVNACFWNKVTLSFTAANITAKAFLMPWLPSPLHFASGGTSSQVKINGQGVGTGEFLTGWCAANSLWSSGDCHAPGTMTANPYQASRIRFSSIGMRIRYTGPALAAAGMISVFKMPLALEDPVTTTISSASTSTPSTGVCCTAYSISGTLNGFRSAGVPVYRPSNVGFMQTVPTCGVQMFRPEQGVVVRLSHSGDFEYVPYFDTYAGLAVDYNVNDKSSLNVLDGLYTQDLATAYGGRNTGGLSAFDNSWTPVCVLFEGCNTDASFLIETCICAEIQPKGDSAMATVANNQDSKNLVEIDRVEHLINAQGPAVALN